MITKFKIYSIINENFNLENQYKEIFGVPKNKEQIEHMRRWMEEAVKHNTVEKSTEEVIRGANSGEYTPFYQTMENTYEDTPDIKDEDLINFYKSKNRIRTDDDIKQMLAWYKTRKDSRHHTPQPNVLGQEQRQIPSNKGQVTT